MNYQQARAYLLGKPEAWEDFPFRLQVAVMKIGEKIVNHVILVNDFFG